MEKNKLIIGLPTGSLKQATLALFKRAGWQIYANSRGYKPPCDDEELDIRLLRAQEIGRYVSGAYLDCGITGRDWIAENRAKVKVLCDLRYSKSTSSPTRWVLAAPRDSDIKNLRDLEGKTIAAEAVGLVEDYLAKKNVKAKVVFSWGATEVKTPELADAIVDITETGSSLRANNLRIVDVITESYPQFVANPQAYKVEWKRTKMERIALMLLSAIQARGKVGVKLNIRRCALNTLIDELPALNKPTVANLAHRPVFESKEMCAEEDWVAVESVLEESVLRRIIPRLKELGAEGIIEYPLNKVIY